MTKGGATIELMADSRDNFDRQIDKLSERSLEAAMKGFVKLMTNAKTLAQQKLKADGHIVTSRLRNSIYIKTGTKQTIPGNKQTYSDGQGRSFNADFDVELTRTEVAIGTNVEYAAAIELGARPHTITSKNGKSLGTPKSGFFGKTVNHPGFSGDSYLYWGVKNTNPDQMGREIAKTLLKGIK